ncbi:DUF3021 domain-containing protein [Streptococcus uberis]|uniref:DUF3021 domain-containing protein n=1 Tax=Streptococcus uberis TaxID=1349 RepID=UPI002EA80197|nr:DUF3021 domain-containing protein [Streptococcus uberis]
MKKIINTYIYGMGIGGILYIISLALSNVQTQTFSNIASCLFFSGLMGLVSLIYDWKKIPFILQNLLHFLGIFLLVYAINYYNGWINPDYFVPFFIRFLIIYLIVWLCIYLLNYQTSKEINKKLQERRQGKKRNQ